MVEKGVQRKIESIVELTTDSNTEFALLTTSVSSKLEDKQRQVVNDEVNVSTLFQTFYEMLTFMEPIEGSLKLSNLVDETKKLHEGRPIQHG